MPPAAARGRAVAAAFDVMRKPPADRRVDPAAFIAEEREEEDEDAERGGDAAIADGGAAWDADAGGAAGEDACLACAPAWLCR